eukprot:7473934-Karenia_brevis.AAC.1
MGRHIDSAKISTLHLQREFSILADEASLDLLIQSMEDSGDESGLRRLRELFDKGVCHDWLWKIDPKEGSRMAEEDFVQALQGRLGAEVVDPGEIHCRLCGELLDPTLSHSMCCAKGESTKGHYAVVSALVDGIAVVDPTLRTEVR